MHDIIFSNDVLADLKLQRDNYSQCCVLVDENTKRYCLPFLSALFVPNEIIEIKSGEENKNLETCQLIWQKMTERDFDRQSLLVNLGGGVIGDMGGFCASVYKRGIHFIQIPTTLLAQVDASIGGKVGVDFAGYKNQLGSFNNPVTTIIDVRFLKTLPERQIRSGLAEIIKHYLIADQQGWDVFCREKNYQDLDWLSIITRSLQIKRSIVEKDPYEQGLRGILNFGHTIGHAVESYFLSLNREKHLLHGEAVAIGMICEAYMAKEKGMLTEAELQSLQDVILGIFGKSALPEESIEQIIQLTAQDKKNIGAQVMCALLDGIGSGVPRIGVDNVLMMESLLYYRSLVKQ